MSIIERVILAAIKGHQTYAYTGESDGGWISVDSFAECKCLACRIARAARIGHSECQRQRRETYARLMADAAEHDRAKWKRNHPDWDEVPF